MNIPIFEAPWTYNGGRISGLGQSSEVIQHARIHSLVDHESNSWNHQLISYYFDDVVVDDILKTPLFSQVREDQFIWNAISCVWKLSRIIHFYTVPVIGLVFEN